MILREDCTLTQLDRPVRLETRGRLDRCASVKLETWSAATTPLTTPTPISLHPCHHTLLIPRPALCPALTSPCFSAPRPSPSSSPPSTGSAPHHQADRTLPDPHSPSRHFSINPPTVVCTRSTSFKIRLLAVLNSKLLTIRTVIVAAVSGLSVVASG